MGPHILGVVGASQLCAGQDGDVRLLCMLLVSLSSQLIVKQSYFVDASNAFNLLNRHAALRNTFNLCPSLASVVFNCYREKVPLFTDGEFVLSSESTTQGDPLSMAL